LDKGWQGRDWYAYSGIRLREAVGNDWKAATQIAAAIAYLSRADSVIPNVGHALTAYRNYLNTGDVGLVGRYPNFAQPRLNEIFKTGDWSGFKTNSFFRNILEEYDPVRYAKEFGKQPVTVDRWIVRAFGFGDDNVGARGRYRALETLIKELARQ